MVIPTRSGAGDFTLIQEKEVLSGNEKIFECHLIVEGRAPISANLRVEPSEECDASVPR